MTARDPDTDLQAMLDVLGHEDDLVAGARPEEREAARAHWAQAFEPLAAIAEPVAAPPSLWARIETSLRAERGRAAAPAPAARRGAGLWERLWDSVGLWRALAAGAAAAAIVLAVLGRAPVAPAHPAFVAVLQAQDGDRRAGFVVEVAADRSLRLVPLGSTEVAAGKALQFWTLADKAKGPHSLGLVPGDTATSLPPEALPGIAGGQLFEVTLEPEGGSPIGRPTGPILYKGLAAKT